jgi:hypothetical protein
MLPQGLGVELGMVGLESDCGRVDDQLGARDRIRACDLREPLIPLRRATALDQLVGQRQRGHREWVAIGWPLAEATVLVVPDVTRVYSLRARDTSRPSGATAK